MTYYLNHLSLLGALLMNLEWVMNDKMSQFTVMNDTVNDKKGHNIVNDKQLCS